MHDFDDSLANGKRGEDELDAFFGQFYEVQPATWAQQLSGIDRVFIRRDNRLEFTVEYKCAFIETVSVSTTDAPGWILKSHAQWLVYFLPVSRAVRVVSMVELKREFDAWFKRYGAKVRNVPNRGRGGEQYFTSGFTVPLFMFDKVVRWKRTLPKRSSDIP
jgi:hypothetical protein